jgi:hypothetical protein
LAIGTANQVLTSSGTAPQWSTNLTIGSLSATSISDSGNLTFTSTGSRILGDFSNATVANRVAFQSSTTNGNSIINALPNGTGTNADFRAFNNSDPTNSAFLSVGVVNAGTEARLNSSIAGTGTYLPMTFVTGGSERLRIDTSGNINIATVGARITGDFSNATIANRVCFQTNTTNGNTVFQILPNGTSNISVLDVFNNSDPTNAAACRLFVNATEASLRAQATGTGTFLPLTFATSAGERMRIHASGGVSIGNTTDPGAGSLIVNSEGRFGSGLAIGSLSDPNSTFLIGGAVLSSGAGTHFLKWSNVSGLVTYDTSSRLVKTNIEDSPYGLAEILKLKPRKYFRTDDQRIEHGLIADEVVEIMPEYVPMVPKSLLTKDDNDTELVPGGVNYERIVAPLINAIHELNAQIDALKLQIGK